MLCEGGKKCTSMKKSTLLIIIKVNTSRIQYFLRCQLFLSLSRYTPDFYRTYGSLHSSWECYSTLSRTKNSRNPSWYSTL